MPHRIIKTISGRKGSALVLMAFIFIPVSAAQIIRRPESGSAMSWLPEWLSHGLLGWILLACSFTAFVIGLVSKRAKTSALSVGYGLMMLPPAILAFIYTIATVTGISPMSYVAASVFLGYAALVWLISGWDEATPPPPMTEEQRQIVRGGAA